MPPRMIEPNAHTVPQVLHPPSTLPPLQLPAADTHQWRLVVCGHNRNSCSTTSKRDQADQCCTISQQQDHMASHGHCSALTTTKGDGVPPSYRGQRHPRRSNATLIAHSKRWNKSMPQPPQVVPPLARHCTCVAAQAWEECLGEIRL